MRTGLITLPIGIALLIDPGRVARRLGGDHEVAMRLIGVADLALVPGLMRGNRRWRWMAARAALNLSIAGYCLRLVSRGGGGAGGKVAASAMVLATIADAPAIAALRRQI